MDIIQTKMFAKEKKRLFPNQINYLDNAIRDIIANPTIGNLKKSDLEGVRVYKFRILKQEFLLAYFISKYQLSLLSFGTHKNFYRDLKNQL